MNEKNMLRAFGEINEKYILEALPEKYEKKSIRFFMSLRSSAAVLAVILLLGGTSSFAAYRMIHSRILVNRIQTPELDEMYCVGSGDFAGFSEKKTYPDYKEVMRNAGVRLLDSELSTPNPYMQVRVDTDGKDYAIIHVENYILGDTGNYQLVKGINRYNCDPGRVYHSSVSLQVNMILSEEQAKNGFDYEYLGFYEYMTSNVSEKGYKVNILQDTVQKASPAYVSRKTAVFVADGIMYALSGRVSVDEMMRIVDSMDVSGI